MAAELSQDAVLSFLRRQGGRVRNAELLAHFRRFLREGEHEQRARNRELFKRFVNAVAVVRQQDGSSVVALKKRFVAPPGAGEAAEERGREASGKQEKSESASANVDQESYEVLPCAGILNGSALAGEKLRESWPHAPAATLHPTAGPQHSHARPEKERGSAPSATEAGPGRLNELGRRWTPSPEQLPSAAPPVHFEAGRRDRGPSSALSAFALTPGETSRTPWQTACEEAQNTVVCSQVTAPGCESPGGPEEAFGEEAPTPCQSEGRENGGSAAPMEPYLDWGRRGLSASHGDLWVLRDGEAERPVGEQWASDEALDLASAEPSFKVREMLRRAQDSSLLAFLHRPERKIAPLHHSTGNLNGGGTRTAAHPKPQNGAAVPLRHGASRTRSELRSRMCRSLGADLDQPFHEDVVSARQNRLYLLSSTLSINYPLSAYSRAHGYKCPAGPEAKSRSASTNEGFYSHRTVVVPLDSKEHDWLLYAASGNWTEVYALFREEPSLLDKRDFISGYTVLHWIAKHGDHRVLNTLWYGVSKVSMDLDVDTRTTCGYTPLHLAAIHGHKKMIRLLVLKFKANVFLRDTSGKRPWQYLGSCSSSELLQLLGAPGSRAAGGKKALCSDSVLVHPNATSPRVKRHTSLAAFLKHKPLLKAPPHSESFV